MRTYLCLCGNRLFFDNILCLACERDTGMCPACQQVVSLDSMPSETSERQVWRCSNPRCQTQLRKCQNYELQGVCNRCLPAESEEQCLLCDYCELTSIIPDLSVEGNHEKWRRLERAKHRVLYVLDLAGIPFRPESRRLSDSPGSTARLSFEFRADEETPVATGHKDGCITINIREAEDVEREKARVAFGEPQRTLVGHIRHELGHYYWDRFVRGRREDEYRTLFGDERNPTYSDALERYYESGPPADWQEEYISAYATMHSWEDFAETFGSYLDMISVLDTANHFAIVSCDFRNIQDMIDSYQTVGLIANEFNRDMGLVDLVPEVFVPAVIEKLRFIHSLWRE